jgi:hypothetical protein
MLQGSNIGYGESEALTLKSDFSLSVPELTPARGTIQAKSEATFVEVGGQKITGLTADTTYSGLRLTFDATAQEGKRQLSAAGSAIFHPDHREVHVGNLALQSEQIRWQTVAGEEATIHYAPERLAVDNLRLVSGDQRLEAEGVLGVDERNACSTSRQRRRRAARSTVAGRSAAGWAVDRRCQGVWTRSARLAPKVGSRSRRALSAISSSIRSAARLTTWGADSTWMCACNRHAMAWIAATG